jgi:hypothetical protein
MRPEDPEHPDVVLQRTRASIRSQLGQMLQREWDFNGHEILPEPAPAADAPGAPLSPELEALVTGTSDDERAASRAAILAARDAQPDPTRPIRPQPDPSQGHQGSVSRPAGTPLERIVREFRNHPNERR